MKRLLSIFTLLAVIIISSGCAKTEENNFVGTWYSGLSPDGVAYEFYEDGMLTLGNFVGNYHVEESKIIIEYSSDLEPEVLSICDYNGEICFTDSFGIYYFKSYDLAKNFYNEQQEEEERLELAKFENFKEYVKGTWYGSTDDEITLVLNEDGTFECNHQYAESTTGTWEAKVSETNPDYYQVILKYTTGNTDCASVRASYFETEEDMTRFEEREYLRFPGVQWKDQYYSKNKSRSYE